MRDANLSDADLSGANLQDTNLVGAMAAWADFSRASLGMAKLAEISLPQANLERADLRRADLAKANLGRANLTLAALDGACLVGAHLVGARLRSASMVAVDLTGANLSSADLGGNDSELVPDGGAHAVVGTRLDHRDFRGRPTGDELVGEMSEPREREARRYGANLTRATLKHATLNSALLRGVDLSSADLWGATLHRADLLDAHLRETSVTNLMLSESWANARSESAIVDWKSVARSLSWDGLQAFLVRNGMPDTIAVYLIESARTIDEMDLFTMLQSVFLSYGDPDAEFADRLRTALSASGVKTWFFPRDAEPGARLHRHIHEQINAYDRMILCCSASSLRRNGVLHEVEEALEREQREGGSEVLIPVMLDSFLGERSGPPEWWPAEKRHVYLAIVSRAAADFRGTMDDEGRWAEQIGRVLKALRK